MKIFLTGSSGFVGSNLIEYLKDKYEVNQYVKKTEISITENIVIHLAGKAHDLKNITNSDEYYHINSELTQKVFDAFINSNAKIFITLSSVKAVADKCDQELTEYDIPKPITHYGKSKLKAEEYILSKKIPEGKRIFILRPCMIHGPGNKGNLNLLYKLVSKGIPWPLGSFENSRSFCSLGNLLFIIEELIQRDDIPSGIYNIADDKPLSTNDLISVISESLNKSLKIWKIPKKIIYFLCKIGDLLNLPLNTESLGKLTESFIVSNKKIKIAIGKELPYSVKAGLIKTFNSFEKKILNI